MPETILLPARRRSRVSGAELQAFVGLLSPDLTKSQNVCALGVSVVSLILKLHHLIFK
jgi:hypothetical protein